MSNKSIALIVKFVMTFIAALFTLGFMNDISLLWILIISSAATVINYILGDLVILPNIGNVISSFIDGLLVVAIAYMFELFVPGLNLTITPIILLGLLVAVSELFFHTFILGLIGITPKEK